MNDNKEKEATGAQYAQFGLMVSLRTTKTLGEKNFSFDAMQQLLGDPDKPVDSIVDKVVREIFGINFDKWVREKEKISKFYEVCFGIKVDWKGIVIPTGPAEFNHLELILKELTEDQIYNAYAKKFGKDKVWKYYDSISKTINRDKGGEALRPKGNYLILHLGGDEPDVKHLNKSYNDFSDDGNKYMIVKEGMIAAMRYRFETDKMYDVKGLTRFHSLDADGYAMLMFRDSYGQFNISWYDRGNRYSDNGPRQGVF